MKDIRIITGKQIIPSLDTVTALLMKKNERNKEPEIKRLYDALLPGLKIRLRPKAALFIETQPVPLVSRMPEKNTPVLYAMLTIGGGIGRLIEKYTTENDLLSAIILDAMADSCLFKFEEQLLPTIRQICLEFGYGIACRLELPADLPMETQKIIFDAVEADRTLGLSITDGYMLNPAKSMSLAFALTNDISQHKMEHNCLACTNENCPLRQSSAITLKVENASASLLEIACPKGGNLLQILQKHHIFPPADCGGMGICGKCGVRIKEGWLPVTEEDASFFSETELSHGMRLSCRAVLQNNCTISLFQAKAPEFTALGSTESDVIKVSQTGAAPADSYGIAIDIGTTTLAFSLLHFISGKIQDSYTSVNSQRSFGSDVISRIHAANSGKTKLLQEMIKKDLFHGISTLLERNRINPRQLSRIAIAANTVMLHLLRGRSCEGFARYPFTPENLALEVLPFEEVFGMPFPGPLQPDVTLLPGISAFVGADITAGLFACHFENVEEPALFLDLGTNGEMALKTKEHLFVTSTAAGPAFEGGSIKWGVGSIDGAISQVEIQNNIARIKTIGNRPPEGICGTGVIETTAELLSAGLLDHTGKLSAPYFEKGFPLAQTQSGEWISFTQNDIRKLQMAKAAVRAGMEILFLRAGIRSKEVRHVFLAGGFGCYLNVKKAAGIGILPETLIEKTTASGNTSLAGALMYLSGQNQKALSDFAAHATEIPLARDNRFQELYLFHMGFN